MKIRFNNHHGNHDEKNKASKTIDVKGDCQITNYDPKNAKPKSGEMTLSVFDSENRVEYNGKKGTSKQEVNMNQKKYSVFNKIASMDGKGNDLTESDLKAARQDYDKNKKTWLKLGVTEFRFDPNAGVASIKIGDKELLRIDFETKAEKAEKAKKNENSKKTENNKTQKTSKKSSEANTKQNEQTTNIGYYKQSVTLISQKMGISESKLKKEISKIAKNTGSTEALVIQIMATENFIRKAKDIGDGEITVGFGHTTKADSNTRFKKGFVISNEQAFQWLEQDIKDKTKKAKRYFAECNWDEIPQSIKDAIIDISFNRGDGAMSKEQVYRSLRENLKCGRENDPASAVRTRQEFKSSPEKRTVIQIGLMKRNCYRFLLAIQDLSPRNKIAAMNRFQMANKHGENYYQSTLKLLRKIGYTNEANTLKKDWERVEKEAKSQLNA